MVADNLPTVFRGLLPHASPFFRPFSFIAVRDSSQILVGISPATGMPQVNWLNRPNDTHQLSAMVDLLENQQGWPVAAVVSLPLLNGPQRSIAAQRVAAEHAREVETMNALGKLGDNSHVRHLENDLRRFLEDHPEPSRNVFVMMRFANTAQMNQSARQAGSRLTRRFVWRGTSDKVDAIVPLKVA